MTDSKSAPYIMTENESSAAIDCLSRVFSMATDRTHVTGDIKDIMFRCCEDLAFLVAQDFKNTREDQQNGN